MRIIPDDVKVTYAVIDRGPLDYSSGNPMYHQDDTIEFDCQWTAEQLVILAKIKPAEWDEIYRAYTWDYFDRQLKWIGEDMHECKTTLDAALKKVAELKTFSQYLKALISLAGEGK